MGMLRAMMNPRVTAATYGNKRKADTRWQIRWKL